MITSWLHRNEQKLREGDLPGIWAEARAKAAEFLDLSKNQFRQITFPDFPLPALKVLDISYNQAEIAELVFPVHLFPNLQYLYLYQSKIRAIRFTGDLPQLDTLHLAENQLTTFDLPPGFLALETLYLYKNPIQNIPRELLDGYQLDNVWKRVKAFFKYDQSQRSYLREGKMLLIGNGEVGKTSIRLKLLDRNAVLPQKTDRTPGIDLSPIKYKVKHLQDNQIVADDEVYVDRYKVKGLEFFLHIWDFGGQGKYREVQQLFCSRRSLYLFVTAHNDQPIDEDYVGFEYWLSMANAFGYDKRNNKYSPIIYVVNKVDQKDNGINEISLKQIFPNIYKFVKISCETLNQFDDLEKAIAETLPKVGEDIFKTEFPNPWLAVKETLEDLEKQGKTHILYVDYLGICAQEKVDESEAKTLIETLDLMGYLVYYGENPKLKDWIILNPRWVKDAIYKVLDNGIVIGNYGRFTPANFPHVWAEYEVSPSFNQKSGKPSNPVSEKYKQEERDKLVNLMLAYEFCYEQTDRHGKPFYLIPALFGTKPSIKAALQTFDYQIRFIYHPFIPAGTVNKLIVRLHEQIYQDYKWKNGVILHDLTTNAFAQVVEAWKEKVVYVSLKGQNVQPLYNLIFQTLEAQNQDFKATKFLAQLDFSVEVFHGGDWHSLKTIKTFKIKDFNFLFENSHVAPVKSPSPMKIPAQFVAQLEEQVTRQYEDIIRFRKLKNLEINQAKRDDYQSEIDRCNVNIEETEEMIYKDTLRKHPQLDQDELRAEIRSLKNAVESRIDFVHADLKAALAQINLSPITTSLATLQEAITTLQEEHFEGVMELANLILDVAEQQEDAKKEIANNALLIKGMKSSDLLEAKVKFAVPLLEHLGLAKVEAEVEFKASEAAKRTWAWLKNKLSGKK
jgi:GTPase SAR1 family protein